MSPATSNHQHHTSTIYDKQGRAETNIKFYNSNIFQTNEQINELFFKNFLNKQMLKWTSSFVNDFNFECYQKTKSVQVYIYL